MKYIVNLKTESPISLREGRELISHATLDYISGSVIWGTLAAAHAAFRQNQTEFDAFFFNEQVKFGNFYPALFERDALKGNSDPVYPLPNTALSCKRFSGFKADGKVDDRAEDQPHGVWDGLVAWTLFALSQSQNMDVFVDLQRCPDCNHQETLDHFDGFYRDNQKGQWGRAKPKTEIRTRTGINRRWGTVEQGIIYNREVIAKGTRFWGILETSPDMGDAFYEFVQEVQEYGMLRLGNNRTRGLGNVTLELNKAEAFDSTDNLKERVIQFNAKLQEQAKQHDLELPHAGYIPLTLSSDVILTDSLLRYQRTITAHHLAEAGIPGAELIYQNSKTKTVLGWHNLWGLPKADELAISMGAVFLFGFKQPFTDWSALLELQTQGLGSRRREGFGQLMIANPFHWEVKGL